MTCKDCRNKGCNAMGTDRKAKCCDSFICTNADRIRAMSDEELAKHLMYDLTCGGGPPDVKCDCVHVPVEACEKCWLDWLKQEANDGRT